MRFGVDPSALSYLLTRALHTCLPVERLDNLTVLATLKSRLLSQVACPNMNKIMLIMPTFLVQPDNFILDDPSLASIHFTLQRGKGHSKRQQFIDEPTRAESKHIRIQAFVFSKTNIVYLTQHF